MTTFPNHYDPGDVISVLFTITDGSGAAFDPATVKFHYTDPLGVDYLKVYLTDSVVSKISTGVYRLLIYVPYMNNSQGEWVWDAEALDGSSNSLVVEHGWAVVDPLRTLA